MELLGNFRNMVAKEISEAKKVFGNSLPYNEIHIHIGSWLADISSFFKKNPNAITTMRVVHFPSGVVLEEGIMGGETKDNFDWLMHELTHVWQGEHVGPMYMAHALYAQATENNAYDYSDAGKTKMQTLIDADAAGKHFTDYNPEQMGDIVKDYYRNLVSAADNSAWDPFINEVKAA